MSDDRPYFKTDPGILADVLAGRAEQARFFRGEAEGGSRIHVRFDRVDIDIKRRAVKLSFYQCGTLVGALEAAGYFGAQTNVSIVGMTGTVEVEAGS